MREIRTFGSAGVRGPRETRYDSQASRPRSTYPPRYYAKMWHRKSRNLVACLTFATFHFGRLAGHIDTSQLIAYMVGIKD